MTIYLIILVLVIFGILKYDLNKEPFVSKADEPATNLILTVQPPTPLKGEKPVDSAATPPLGGLGTTIRIRVLHEQPWSNVLFYAILVILVAVSTFGYKMGTDTAMYEREFSQYNTLFNLHPYDFNLDNRQPGWILFQSFCRTIFDSYYFMKFVYATFVNTAIFLTIHRYTRYVYFGILFYLLSSYLYFNFEILRQGMGIAIFLIGYPYVLRRKWHWYFLCVILAYSMHNSAAVLMFLPLFHTFDRSALIGILLLCLLVFFNSAWLGQTITQFMSSDLLADTSAAIYLDNDSLLSIARFRTYLIMFAFPLAMLLVFRFEGINIRYHAVIMFYAVTVIAGEFAWILFRFQQYFIIFAVIFYVESFIYLARRLTFNYRRIVAPMLMLLMVYFYVNAYFNNVNDTSRKSYERYFPYSSIFDKESAPYREDMRF